MKANGKLLIGALALGLALPAAAATMTGGPLPQPVTKNGITYLSGGIGRTEAQAMRAEAKHYPLSMTFSMAKDNEFLAKVPVTIKDSTGKTVLDTVSEGPILLVKLPEGKYSVIAEAYGKTYRRTVHVKAKGDTPLYFHWAKA
jgi:hypothetical protein